MAKVKRTKKTEKPKKNKVEEQIEEQVTMPPIDADIINISFSKDELATFANLMSICAQMFEHLATQASEQKDDNANTILTARHKLSNMYAYKLISSFSVGEPESRNVH